MTVHRILVAASAGFLAFGAVSAGAASHTELPVACVAGACGQGGPGTWVTSGSAAQSRSGNTLTINQKTDKAILNWASFNVGADGRVVFKQPAKTSIAFNRIFQDNPSVILGEVKANGEIYLVNPNGMIFGKTAKIDASGILASTLQISDDTFKKGLLSPDLLATAAAALQSDGRVGVLNADGTPKIGPDGQPVKIQLVVEKGAQLSSSGAGGRVMLAGQNVINAGSVKAADGQVVLAAGEKVYLQASDDPALRGLLVEVDTGGQAWNQATGQLSATHGNVTVVGLAVNQDGRISASTSVSANGSVRLLARDTVVNDSGANGKFEATHTGTLELGKQSSIEILPDVDDPTTAVAEQPQLASTIELNGRQIFMRSGARITAPSGKLTVTAQANPKEPQTIGPSDRESRIRVESGVKIDLSGTIADAPMSRNMVTVELRGNELRDSPLQRDGFLRGQTVVVDARVGTPLADVSGAVAAIPRTVAERTTAGGTVVFNSEGDTVIGKGAVVDISGGRINYQGGAINTSMLITADGRVVDIGSANPNDIYVGILQPTVQVKHDRWGVIDNFAVQGAGHWEPGYVSGASAGTLQFAAPAMQLDGTFLGHASSGAYQRDPGSTPLGGRLIIGNPGGSASVPLDYRAPSVTFVKDSTSPAVADEEALPDSAPLDLPVDYLTQGGFTRTEIYSNGTVTLPKGTPLDLRAGSSFSVRANRIDVLADIRNPGGTLSFTADGVAAIPGATTDFAGVHIGAGTVLDVRGTWTNDSLLDPQARPTDAIFRDGGTISFSLDRSLVNAGHASELVVGDGAQLLAGGGAWIKQNGQVVGGRGGKISLLAGVKDSAFELGDDVTLQGFGVAGATGGSLSLNASRIAITGGGAAWADSGRVEFGGESGTTLKLHAPLFSDFGFTTFDLLASGPRAADSSAIATVTSGTKVEIAPRSWLLDDASLQRASGASVQDFATVGLLDTPFRPTTSFSLRANPQDIGGAANVGGLRVERGVELVAGAKSQFEFSSVGGMVIDGSITARGGTIRLTTPSPDLSVDGGYDPNLAIDIEKHARLDVSGTTVLLPQTQPLRTGEVLAGGSIIAKADRGSILMREGSVLDISGTQASLDLATGNAATPYERHVVASSAGSLTLRAAETMWLRGTVRAKAGVGDIGKPSGASLSVELTRADAGFIFNAQVPFPNLPRVVTLATATPDSAPDDGEVSLSSEWVKDSGFDSVAVAADNEIHVDDGVTLKLARQLILDSPVLSMTEGRATLSASLVQLGSTDAQDAFAAPTAGTGRLDVSGDFLEIVGSSVMQGIGVANLVSKGDLRLRGTDRNGSYVGSLRMGGGQLNLGAARIYPATATEFLLESAGGSGSAINISQTGKSPGTPLSVAGHLTLRADTIVQGGTVLAPFGIVDLQGAHSIKLTAGSTTSVSGAGTTFPYGYVENGKRWLYGVGSGVPIERDAIPSRNIRIDGDSIEIGKGATVDIRGGGDLHAYEWLPGTGGSVDALAPGETPGLYAVLPSMRDQIAPYDPQEYIGSDLRPGDSIYLSGDVGGLKAGTYALLPARYALLPGAYLVSPVEGSGTIQSGMLGSLPDGTPVVSGQRTFGSTGLGGTLFTGFAVHPGSYGRELAEYRDALASDFYPARAGRPADAGTLSLSIGSSLDALGTVRTEAEEGGLGAQIDLAAAALEIVNEVNPASTATQIRGDILDKWNAGRLVIGGRTSLDGDGLEVVANDVSVGSGVSLSADQVVLVARDNVTLEKGAEVSSRSAKAAGPFAAPDRIAILDLVGDGADGAALVAVSDQAQVLARRPQDVGGAGQVILNEGSQLRTRGALTIDAPGGASLLGTIDASGAAVSLGSRHLVLGTNHAQSGDLTVTSRLFNQLADVSSLRLMGSDSIDFAGSVLFGNMSQLERLELNTSQLRNVVANNQVSLSAREVVLRGGENVGGAAGIGSGVLEIHAANVTVGPGAMQATGFNRVNIRASGQIAGKGAGLFTTSGNLDLAAARFTSGAGADTTIESTGTLRARSIAASSEDLPALELGGGLTLHGRDVDFSGVLALPSGFAEVSADERLMIGSGSVIDVSGTEVTAAGRKLNSSAGVIRLSAGDDLTAAEGSRLTASAEGGANAGAILVHAGGNANLAGDLRAAAAADAGRSGIFEIDAGSIMDFAALNAELESGGFHERRSVHVKDGDLVFAAGTQSTARVLQFATDSGSITVSGDLVASSTSLGRGLIRLYAGADFTLASGGSLVADGSSSSARGGTIEVGSAQGFVTLAQGGRVSAAGTEQSGDLRIRAAADLVNGDINVAALDSDLSRVGSVVLEPVLSFDVGGQLFDGDFAAVRADVDAYAAVALPNIQARFGSGVGIQPGVELRSAGDLAINGSSFDTIDLTGWRYDGQPIALSIRAAGTLTFNGILSDGFRDLIFNYPPQLKVLPGPSATFRMVAGADLSGADPLALLQGSSADLTLAAGTKLRTATGDIQLAAAGDIVFAADPFFFDPAASVFTAGYKAAPTTLVGFGDQVADFYRDGGDVRLSAGGSIIGAPVTQSPGSWMPRGGDPDTERTFWGLDASRFGWNLGALGGGDVDIRAAGDVKGLSVAVADSAIEKSPNRLTQYGGGGLNVEAGQDIGAGMYYVAGGDGLVRAGRSIKAVMSWDGQRLAPLFMLGNGNLTLDARRDVALESVLSPNALMPPDFFGLGSFFFNYGDDSGLTVRSNGGSISVGTTAERLSSMLGFDVAFNSDFTLTVLPPSLALRAFGGDVVINNALTLFPADHSQLDLFATRDVTSEFGVILMSDAAPATVATPLLPSLAASEFNIALGRYEASARHLDDPLPALVTAGRDVRGLILLAPKAMSVRAGRDIVDTSIGSQNLRTSDVTSIVAGRDVAYGAEAFTDFITVDGPGRLDVLAGRNVDLGFSQGITTLGALTNPEIPVSSGADVTVIAGASQPLDAASFLKKIVSTSQDYRELLVQYVESHLGGSALSFEQAQKQLASQGDEFSRPLLLEIFFRELVKCGREANTDPSLGFSRGYAAVDALFPESNPYGGDINMEFSRIYTLAGGNISLLAPGGFLNVGLANPPATLNLQRGPSELGIVAQRSGDVRVFTNKDVLVNQSRLFTLLGGDIAVWSTLGNIDAGRGAKSAISAPPPRVIVSASGSVTLDVTGAVSGSGIRTIVTDETIKPGDVDLIAPAGFVNAGDAGIGSAGNLNIAAQQVVGLDNIQVGGVSTGVPADTSGLGASLSGVSNVASSANSAAGAAVQSKANGQARSPLAAGALNWLEVFVEGFGEETCKASDEDCLSRNRKL